MELLLSLLCLMVVFGLPILSIVVLIAFAVMENPDRAKRLIQPFKSFCQAIKRQYLKIFPEVRNGKQIALEYVDMKVTDSKISSEKKREVVVQKFSDEYELHLTEDQMKNIVNASYMSKEWEIEVESMAKKYASVYEWIESDSKLVRLYLYIFSHMEISSDFEEQKRIAKDSFQKIYDEIDQYGIKDERLMIQYINESFFTNLDEETYKKMTLYVSPSRLLDEDLREIKRNRSRQLDKLKAGK